MAARDCDVFISYASEDRESVARPLREQLARRGFEVWLDELELEMGDSLRDRLQEGMVRSRYGVVILSEAYFSKRWPLRELSTLLELEESRGKVVLPIWHGIDHARVSELYPMIADRLAESSEDLEKVVTSIQRVLVEPKSLTTDVSVSRSDETSYSNRERRPLVPEHLERWFNSLGMEFVFLSPGTFTMGSDTGERGRREDERSHLVTLTQGFHLGATAVTQAQFHAVTGEAPWKGGSFVRERWDMPATYIDWEQAKRFCRLLSDRSEDSYRLPTEAEWEYACRAGTVSVYSFGDTPSHLRRYACSRVREWERYILPPRQLPVASRLANSWGLYDMHGGVLEWCEDYYAVFTGEHLTDPMVDAALLDKDIIERRVLRGGCFNRTARHARSASRSSAPRRFSSFNTGFRTVREAASR